MKGRQPPDDPGTLSVQTHDDGATFEIPEDAIQPESFGLHGISEGEHGLIVFSPEGAPVLVFDLETAKILANAIRHAVAKVEQGMRDRAHGKKRTTPSA